MINKLIRKCKNVAYRQVKILQELERLKDDKYQMYLPNTKLFLRSYGQYGEDTMIWKLFQMLGIEKPTYIDIGAHDPYEISNTALMYEHGSRGINIEANPNLFKAFLKERPEDINICCGLGASEGVLPFYMIDDTSCYNTFDKSVMDALLKKKGLKTKPIVKEIKVQTLDSLIAEVGGVMPQYMDIDIEGMEWDVLKDYDLLNNGPIIINIELKQYVGELKNKILNSGYSLLCQLGENHIYVKADYIKDIYI